MAVRRPVRALARQLDREVGNALYEAMLRAEFLMVRATKRFRNPEVKRQAHAGLLSEADLDLTLTDEEVDELARALVAIVDRPAATITERQVARSAATALHGAARLWVLPHLTGALQRWRLIDPGAAQGPAWAIADVLWSVDDPGTVTPEQRRAVVAAGAQLRAAAATEGETADVEDLRRTAQGSLVAVDRLLGPAS